MPIIAVRNSNIDLNNLGLVEKDLPAIQNWNRNQTMESILVGVKNSMSLSQNRKLAQPPEGTTF